MNWEYKTTKISTHGIFFNSLDLPKFDEKLNSFASDGWELVALAGLAEGSGGTTYIIATFKRPKMAPDQETPYPTVI